MLHRRNSVSRLYSLSRVLLAALGLLLIATSCAQKDVPVEIGLPSPHFELDSLDGGKVDLRSLKGRPVVVNFWATWCQPCRREFPVLREMAAEDRAAVVAIALDEEGEAVVRPFVEDNDLDYTILLGDQEVFQRFKGFAIPYTLVLDAELKIVGMYRGPATREDLERDLVHIAEGV